MHYTEEEAGVLNGCIYSGVVYAFDRAVTFFSIRLPQRGVEGRPTYRNTPLPSSFFCGKPHGVRGPWRGLVGGTPNPPAKTERTFIKSRTLPFPRKYFSTLRNFIAISKDPGYTYIFKVKMRDWVNWLLFYEIHRTAAPSMEPWRDLGGERLRLVGGDWRRRGASADLHLHLRFAVSLSLLDPSLPRHCSSNPWKMVQTWKEVFIRKRSKRGRGEHVGGSESKGAPERGLA